MTTLAWGFAALLLVACLVAAWEHGSAQRREVPAPPPPKRAAHVDLDLDAFPEGGDQAKRQATLGSAIERMSAATPPNTAAAAWLETRPMVGPGVAAEEPQA